MTLALRLLKLADRGKYIPRVKPKESKDPEDWITVGEDLVRTDANENTKRVWYKVFSKEDREHLRGTYDSWEDLPGFPDTLEYVMGAGDSWYLYATYQGKSRGYTVNDHMYTDEFPFSSWPPNLDDINFEKRNKKTNELEETYETRKQDYAADMETNLKKWLYALQEKCRKEPARPKTQIGTVGVGRANRGDQGVVYMTTRSDVAAPFRNVNESSRNDPFHKDHKHTYLSLPFDELQAQFDDRISMLRKLVEQENRIYWTPLRPGPENTPGPKWTLVKAELSRQHETLSPHDPHKEQGYQMDVRLDLVFPKNNELSFSQMNKRVRTYTGRIRSFRREVEDTLLRPWQASPRYMGLGPAMDRHKAFRDFSKQLFQPFRVDYGAGYQGHVETPSGRDLASLKIFFPVREDPVGDDPKPLDEDSYNQTESEWRRKREHNNNLNEMLRNRRDRLLRKTKTQAQRRLDRILPFVLRKTPRGFSWEVKLLTGDERARRGFNPTLDLQLSLHADESVTTEQLQALAAGSGNPLAMLQLQTQAETIIRYLRRSPGLAPAKSL